MHESATFPPEPSSVSSARHWLRRFLAADGSAEPRLDAELCVSELSANAVRHARTAFTVEIRDDVGPVRISVRDSNHRPIRPETEPDPSDLGGRGLLILDRLAADWGVSDHTGEGKTIWFTIEGLQARPYDQSE
jgi:anti-sigma regulatory factor (Ser/Thr protein kinase)